MKKAHISVPENVSMWVILFKSLHELFRRLWEF